MNRTILCTAFAMTLLVAVVNAQTSPAAPGRHDAAGTITDYTPERALVLHTGTTGGDPLHFRLAQKVTYVDTDGKTVEAAGLRKNMRVRVSYVKQGGDLIVDKVTLLE